MSREWKPGDVALVEAGCWANRKVALRLDEGWSHTNGVNVDGDGVVTPLRRLVVIDPEDREQVQRLYDDYATTPNPSRADALQAALREFANPKPVEPTGLGAVVEDDRGRKWSLLPPHIKVNRWACWDEPITDRDYDGIDVVRVLSEGVPS